MTDNARTAARLEPLVSQPFCGVKPHADDFDEAEYRLRQDIEEAIEQAADCLHDATSWWNKEEKGPRTIDTLIGMIVLAAKRYSQRCLGVGLPDELKILVGRCEVGESAFSNDDMSDALFICQSLLSRVDELEDKLRQITVGRIPQIGDSK